MLDVERERLLDAPPPDRARTGALGDTGARVEERDPGSAHEPFQRPTDEIVDAARVDIEGDRADGLVGVNDQHGPLAVADLCERANVLDPAGREVHVAGANGRRSLVDRALEQLEWDPDAIRAAHELDLRATVRDREERVTVGREVEIRHDHLRPLGVVERARDPDEPGGDVRLDRDLIDGRAEHVRELLAKGFVLADPVVIPGSPALLGPLLEETLDAFAPAAVERGERAVVQIVEVLGDREFGAPGALRLAHHHPAA